MLENPNKYFKTRTTLERFIFGTRKYPSIYRNASTSHSLIWFVSSSQINGIERLLSFLNKRISLTENIVNQNFEKEKSVVLSEEKRYPKNNRNKTIHYTKFVNQGKYKEFSRKIIGEENTIKEIRVSDILKYWNKIYVSQNVVIAIQTGREFNTKDWNKISEFAEKIPVGYFSPIIKEYSLIERSDVDHFYDPDYKNGVAIDISFLEKNKEKGIEYSKEEYFTKKLEQIYLNLVPNVAFLTLRDKMGLIYSMSSFYDSINWHWNIYGFSLITSKEVLTKTMSEIKLLKEKYVPDYLLSKEGKRWLESQISKYLFPLNVDYNSDYALNIAKNISLDLKYIWEFEKSKEAIIQIKIDDILKFNKVNNKRKTGIWSYSSYRGKEIMEIIKKSKYSV